MNVGAAAPLIKPITAPTLNAGAAALTLKSSPGARAVLNDSAAAPTLKSSTAPTLNDGAAAPTFKVQPGSRPGPYPAESHWHVVALSGFYPLDISHILQAWVFYPFDMIHIRVMTTSITIQGSVNLNNT